jgi:hypothetical protein
MLLDLYSLLGWGSGPNPGFSNNPARTRCEHQRKGFDFENIEPTELDVFTIEFTRDLQNGRKGSNPVFSCTVLATDTGATVDGNPSARITGTANLTTSINPVDGSLRTYANQKFGGFIVGNKYAISCTIQTSDGCNVERYSRVYCAVSS